MTASLTYTAIAMNVESYGVSINAVCPGTMGKAEMRGVAAEAVRSPPAAAGQGAGPHTVPLGSTGTPHDAGNIVALLASAEASYDRPAANATGRLWLS